MIHELIEHTPYFLHAQAHGTAHAMSSAVTSTLAAQPPMSAATTVSTHCRVMLWTRAPRSSAAPSRPSPELLAAMLPMMWMRPAPRPAAPTSTTIRLPTLGMFFFCTLLRIPFFIFALAFSKVFFHIPSVRSLSLLKLSSTFEPNATVLYHTSLLPISIVTGSHVPYLVISALLTRPLFHPHCAASSMRTRTPCRR